MKLFPPFRGRRAGRAGPRETDAAARPRPGGTGEPGGRRSPAGAAGALWRRGPPRRGVGAAARPGGRFAGCQVACVSARTPARRSVTRSAGAAQRLAATRQAAAARAWSLRGAGARRGAGWAFATRVPDRGRARALVSLPAGRPRASAPRWGGARGGAMGARVARGENSPVPALRTGQPFAGSCVQGAAACPAPPSGDCIEELARAAPRGASRDPRSRRA